MGRYSLELRQLRKIPAKYLKDPDRIYDQIPAGLDTAYGRAADLSDPWHVQLKIKSRYTSTEDLKAYIAQTHPELDLSSWAYSYAHGRQDLTVQDAAGIRIVIPWEEYEALQKDHVNVQCFEIQTACWSLDLSYNQETWLSPVLPCYITDKIILELAKLRVLWAKKSDPGDRLDRISDAGYTGVMGPDITGFLADGLAQSKSERCALYACLVD